MLNLVFKYIYIYIFTFISFPDTDFFLMLIDCYGLADVTQLLTFSTLIIMVFCIGEHAVLLDTCLKNMDSSF